MSTIYLSHGDKGGIGKTYLATVLTDYLLEHGRHIMAIDGEQSATGKVSNTDFAQRFDRHPNVIVKRAPLNDPRMGLDTIYSVMEHVVELMERHDTSSLDIVINTPANFSHTFTLEVQGLLKTLAQQFDFSLKVTYLLGVTNLAQSAALQIAKDGVLSGNEMVVVFPLKEKSEDLWRADAKDIVDFFIGHEKGFFLPQMSSKLTHLYDTNPDRSLAFFFEKDKPLTMKESLLNNMIRFHLNQVYPLLEKYVIVS